MICKPRFWVAGLWGCSWGQELKKAISDISNVRTNPLPTMAQSHHFKKWGRDISLTSGKAASAMNYKFPTSHDRRSWGIVISPRLLSHSWGIGNVPFVTREEFSIPIFVASPLIWEYPIPISLQTGIGSFLHYRNCKPNQFFIVNLG